MTTIKQEMHECLTNNILHFWLDRMVDNEQGGFTDALTATTMSWLMPKRVPSSIHASFGRSLLPIVSWATIAIWMLRSVPRNISSTTS